MNEPVLLGGCLCGSVRYRVNGALGLAEHCHCSMCRKAHGAAFSSNAVVPSSKFEVTDGDELITQYESSPGRRKYFCSKCGSQLFIRRLSKPELMVITLGTLDAAPNAKPERHVFVASKAPWVSIVDGLPQFLIYPGFEPEGGTHVAEPAFRSSSLPSVA